MAGDEDKKKKKKSKKSDKEEKKEEAPAPEPEPEPEPAAPEPEPEAEPEPAPEGEEPTPVEDAPPAEGETQVEGLEGDALEVPPAPKKKPKFFVHWNRRKPRFYDYNWDYGDNYYSSLVKYMDCKGGDVPRRMAFAERGIRSNVLRRTVPDTRTASLLDDVRRSIRNFELSQKTYMK